NAPNMFLIQIHHGGIFHKYPGSRYVDGHVDIFDMVDIEPFHVIALNKMFLQLGYTCEHEPMFYNYLRPLSSLDEGLYPLTCDEDVCCLATLVRSFKLLESFRVDDLDLNLNLNLNSTFDLNVSQAKTQEEVPMSEVPNDHVVNGSYIYVDVELAVDVVRIEEHVVEQVRVDEVVDGSGEEVVVHDIGEKAVKYGNGHEVVETIGEHVERCLTIR
ncbi:hypothetical protein Tco_1322662, partial [Tanacetum coccineum]